MGHNARTLQCGLQSARAGKPLISYFAKRMNKGVLGVCVWLKVALDLRFDLSKFPDSMTTLTTRSLPRFASILVT